MQSFKKIGHRGQCTHPGVNCPNEQRTRRSRLSWAAFRLGRTLCVVPLRSHSGNQAGRRLLSMRARGRGRNFHALPPATRIRVSRLLRSTREAGRPGQLAFAWIARPVHELREVAPGFDKGMLDHLKHAIEKSEREAPDDMSIGLPYDNSRKANVGHFGDDMLDLARRFMKARKRKPEGLLDLVRVKHKFLIRF